MKHILVTAGPTREKIDPVRFISNYSTGIFGYAIAEEAKGRGHRVTLISGPTLRKPPPGVKFIGVESARDMLKWVLKEFQTADCVIMAAAVSDWRSRYTAVRKLKKNLSNRPVLELVKNPDILGELGKRKKKKQILAGFALETENLERNALSKLRAKKLDIIIANKLGSKVNAFGDIPVKMVIIDRFGKRQRISCPSKSEAAKIILDKVLTFKI